MKADLYKYLDYKPYLNDLLSLRPERGPKARLAEYMGCQLPYLSQVLNASAHLSLEQADLCNQFFGHSRVESLFFLNLVLYARAGTESLKKIYFEQIKVIADEQRLVKNKLNIKKSFNAENEAIYYSSWEYLVIHIATSVKGLQTKQDLSNQLGIPLERVGEVLEYLISLGLVKQNKGQYEITDSGFHLGEGSPFLNKHHTNWRVQALRSLDQMKPEDLHYSSVISINCKDIAPIREVMIQAIADIRKIVREAKKEDVLMSYCLDLFPISKAKK